MKNERSAIAATIALIAKGKGKGPMKLLAVLLMTLPFYVACEPKGPLERAGEEIDEAFEDVRNGGETLGNQIDDAIDDASDGIDDAVDELDDN